VRTFLNHYNGALEARWPGLWLLRFRNGVVFGFIDNGRDVFNLWAGCVKRSAELQQPLQSLTSLLAASCFQVLGSRLTIELGLLELFAILRKSQDLLSALLYTSLLKSSSDRFLSANLSQATCVKTAFLVHHQLSRTCTKRFRLRRLAKKCFLFRHCPQL
jgi:hypothetical protein